MDSIDQKPLGACSNSRSSMRGFNENLLDSPAEALVNTVNTVGTMGKGIALMFKDRFPQNFRLYNNACKLGLIKTGKIFVTQISNPNGNRWIVNFPVKQDWRNPSRMEWIIDGLHDLKAFLIANQVKSIAIPPLGAGNGKLDWNIVRDHIERILGDLDIDIFIFEPSEKYKDVTKHNLAQVR